MLVAPELSGKAERKRKKKERIEAAKAAEWWRDNREERRKKKKGKKKVSDVSPSSQRCYSSDTFAAKALTSL